MESVVSSHKWPEVRAEVKRGRGRGHDKGPITVTIRALERQKKPSVTLIFYKLRQILPCHGRGRGFEPRRPRH